MAKAIGTVSTDTIKILSWHLTPLRIRNPEVVLRTSGGSSSDYIDIWVMANFNPDINYQKVLDWSSWQEAGDDQFVVASERCYANNIVSIPLRKEYGLITVYLQGSTSLTFEVHTVCDEEE